MAWLVGVGKPVGVCGRSSYWSDIIGCQAQVSINPPSLLKTFWCRCNSMAFFIRRSMYPFVPSSLCVSLNFIQYPVSMICPAIADLSGCPSQKCLMSSLPLIPMLLLVCPIWTQTIANCDLQPMKSQQSSNSAHRHLLAHLPP
jgi:hypothetical protein